MMHHSILAVLVVVVELEVYLQLSDVVVKTIVNSKHCQIWKAAVQLFQAALLKGEFDRKLMKDCQAWNVAVQLSHPAVKTDLAANKNHFRVVAENHI